MQFHVVAAAEKDTLVVVVDRHRQHNLGLFLADNILVEVGLDFLGDGESLGHVVHGRGVGFAVVVVQQAHAEVYALIANPHAGALYHAVNLVLGLAAERTAVQVSAFITHIQASIRFVRGEPRAVRDSPSLRSVLLRGGFGLLLVGNNLVNQAELHGLLGAHEVIPLAGRRDFLQRLARVVG